MLHAGPIHGTASPAPSSGVRVEHQFQALLVGAPDALIIADTAGHILIANSQAEQLFGYAASELSGQPVELLLPQALHARPAPPRVGTPSPLEGEGAGG